MHTWKTLPFCQHLCLGYINKLVLSWFLPKVRMTAAKLLYWLGTITLILHARKFILKVLQARLQHYVNWELPDVQAGFRKGRGTQDQIANICWAIDKASEFQKKTSTSASFTMLKPLTVWITANWKILKKIGIWDLLCLLTLPATWEICM